MREGALQPEDAGGAHVIAVLGAESTGKSTLAHALAGILSSRGVRATMVPEVLRLFCDQHGRTPTRDEQAAIALEQTRRIEQARLSHSVVLADTTSLMTAIYSELLFGDRGLYAQAEQVHATLSLTLLTSLDIAWAPDGMQRDGPHVREPVDALIRAALARIGQPFAVVAGQGDARVAHALAAIEHVLDAPSRRARAAMRPTWRWLCEACDDGDCEQHWLPRAPRV